MTELLAFMAIIVIVGACSYLILDSIEKAVEISTIQYKVLHDMMMLSQNRCDECGGLVSEKIEISPCDCSNTTTKE